MRRLLICACALVTVGAFGGCGEDDDDPSVAAREGAAPFITLAEAEAVIERGALAVVRTGGDADVGGVAGEPDREETSVIDAARYESQSGREFDLLVFPSRAAARRAAGTVVDVDAGESAVRAVNVMTVFPERYDRVDAYRAVARAMRRLAAACDRPSEADPQLRDVCFGSDRAVPPPGEGVDRDEAQDEEEPIVVGGLHYDPLIARRLNPNIAPDEALLSGRTPPDGKIWFGVFLRVCNRDESAHTSTDRLALVDAFGQRTRPSEALSPDNRFAYRASAIEPDECLPRPGSVAARNDGALVLFAVRPDLLEDLPVALEVGDERVILDV